MNKKYMKTNRWFNRNGVFSRLRIAGAVTLMSAAAAVAFVAVNPSGPFLMGKSEVKNLTHSNHTMSPAALRLASPETVAGVGGPQYRLFSCQVGLSVGQ